jgi:hypothetical protein
MADRPDWTTEDEYWRREFSTRPYSSGRAYDDYRGAYRYGYESADRYRGRAWEDVESDLERGWSSYEHRGTSTWQSVKDAVRDAWNRITGNR